MYETRAVAYIRVSTEKDAQLHSYEFQEQYWKGAFENDPGTKLVGIYADRGLSGHSVSKRPQFLLMMQDAREHKFDKIYTKSVSRFARNTTELLKAVRELRDIGIEVVFEKENIHTFEPTSEIFLTIAAAIAENDLEVDSKRQLWSIQHRCENGWISIGNGLYGLRMTADNELEIVPEEAEVIRFIFDAYVNGGLGSTKIANALNEAGIKTREGKSWSGKHIVRLIRNEKFKGDVIMGKSIRRLGEHLRNPDGRHAPRYYMQNTHEAIIDREIWDAAQRIMDERGQNHCRKIVTHSFSGMIECGCCGKKYQHKVNNGQFKWRSDIWACNSYLKKGRKVCDNSIIKDGVLKAKFVEAYNEFIEKRPEGTPVIALQEVLEDLRRQERELAELAMQRLISNKAYEAERRSIKDQIKTVNEKITILRLKRVPESEHRPITEFDEETAKKFLTKVIVAKFTVTFVFYNGAKITKKYDNGQSGNKPGWNKNKEVA